MFHLLRILLGKFFPNFDFFGNHGEFKQKCKGASEHFNSDAFLIGTKNSNS